MAIDGLQIFIYYALHQVTPLTSNATDPDEDGILG